MAPLNRRTNLTLQGNIAIIILVILFVAGIFCAWIFYKIISKQRRNKAVMQRMQEERTPFVSDQYIPPQGAPSAQTQQPYVYDGPLELPDTVRGPQELQGAGRPIAQEVDGYTAAPTFDDSKPIELPANALVNGGDGKVGVFKR